MPGDSFARPFQAIGESWAHEFVYRRVPGREGSALKMEAHLAEFVAEKLAAMSSVVTCVYCGHPSPPGTPPEALRAHVIACEKHPVATFIAALRAIAALAEQAPSKSEYFGDFGLGGADVVGVVGVDEARGAVLAAWRNAMRAVAELVPAGIAEPA